MRVNGFLIVAFMLLVGCHANVAEPCAPDAGDIDDAGNDSGNDSGPCPVSPWVREDGFGVHVLTPIVELRPGTETIILVCVQRGARFEDPVLLVNSWAPEYVRVETRENRLGDVDNITAIRVRTASLEDSDGASPGEFRVPRMSFSASDGFDRWTTFTVDFTVGSASF